MATLRLFHIHYSFQDKRHTFVQTDDRMADADAWHYACQHAGIGVLHNLPKARNELSALVTHAARIGLTDVRWIEVV